MDQMLPEFSVGARIQVEYKTDYMSYVCEMRAYRVITSPKGTQIVFARTPDGKAAATFSVGDLEEARRILE